MLNIKDCLSVNGYMVRVRNIEVMSKQINLETVFSQYIRHKNNMPIITVIYLDDLESVQ
jgi:hypothetical protein